MGIARKLGIPRVVFPVAAGVMSALGLLASPLSFEVSRTHQRFVRDLDAETFADMFASIEREAKFPLLAAGVEECEMTIVRRLDMRYHGQGHEIEVALPGGESTDLVPALGQRFRERYEALYAFALLDAPMVITTWKVEARGPAPGLAARYRLSGRSARAGTGTTACKGRRRAYFESAGGYTDTRVYDRYALVPGDAVEGPALVEERESTVVIPPGHRIEVDTYRNLVAELRRAPGPESEEPK
jgi:N-methylhydantoinase A